MKRYLYLFFILILLSSCDWNTDSFIYIYDGTPQGPEITNAVTSANYIYTGTGSTVYGPSSIKPTDPGNYLVSVTGNTGFNPPDDGYSDSKSFQIIVSATVSISVPAASLTSCLGSSSNSASFIVTGSSLTESVTITAPTGFDISTSPDDFYSSNLTLTNNSTISQTLYVRLNYDAIVGVNIGTITATTTGVSDATSTISGTVLSLPVLSTNAINLCTEATYLITVTSEIPLDNAWSATGEISVNNGYVTAGTVPGAYTVSYTDGCGKTISATADVVASPVAPAIADGLASYKFDGTPQGPTANLFMGYNGFDYSSTIKPTEPGYYKSNSQLGNSAGCPFQFYIFRCTTCTN